MKHRFLLAAAMMVWSVLLLSGCGKKEKTVAVVDDIRITDVELNRVLSRKVALLGQDGPSGKDRKETLEALIDRKLLLKEAARLGITPTESEVKAEMEKGRSKFPDEKAFRAALKKEGLDLEGARREAEENLAVRKVEGRITAAVQPDEKEAVRYYEEHKGDFLVPPKYRIYLVQAGAEEEAARLLEKFRKSPLELDRSALEEGPRELREINRKALLTPKDDFPDEMHPLLDKMKKGEVGGPVRTKRGYFLFRLLDRTDAFQKPWDMVKRDVSHLMYQEKRENAVRDWLAQQRKQAKIEMFENMP